MAKFEVHCQDCINQLGEPFEYVHVWLDELFPKLGPKHRKERHHLEGVEEVRKMWGDQAAKAAEIHIRRDHNGQIFSKKEMEFKWIFG